MEAGPVEAEVEDMEVVDLAVGGSSSVSFYDLFRVTCTTTNHLEVLHVKLQTKLQNSLSGNLKNDFLFRR